MPPASPHPSHEHLIAYLRGCLSGPDLAIVEDHMSTCAQCAATVPPDDPFLALARQAEGGRLPAEPPDAQLSRMWRQGQRVDVAQFLAGFSGLDATGLVAVLLVDQRCRWQAGERLPAEHYLRRFSALEVNTEAVVELAYGEFLLREEFGERPTLEEYQRRFPAQAERLRQQIELQRALAVTSTSAAETMNSATTVSTEPSGVSLLPSYEILEELGRGGMGVVYKVRQVSLNRIVAVKMIRAAAHAGPAERVRFRTEAEALARLRHPGIVGVHEVGEHDGLPFIVMEFCPGGSLEKKLAGTPMPAAAAAALIRTLALAMQAAHQHQVVHRDLKPANVLFGEDGQPRITDFGLARKLDERGLTLSGTILGTPSYMAPEQARSAPAGPTADVYALGAILYELLTGRPPFKAANPLDTLAQVVGCEPVPPSRLQPRVPRDLETVCLKCLDKEAGRRYATAQELADDLGRFLAGEPVRARPAAWPGRCWKWARRRPAVAGLLGAIVTLTTAALLLLALAWQHAIAGWGEAEQARQAEKRQRQEADAQKHNAQQQKQEADDARKRELRLRREAEERRQKFQRLSASLLLDRGISLSEQKDPRGLLWMTRALEVLKGEDAGLDRAIRINLASWSRQVHRLRFMVPGATSVAFSRDGGTLLAGHEWWDARSGKRLGEVAAKGCAFALFSPDKTKIATLYEKRAGLWDGKSGKPLGKPLEHEGETWLYFATFSPDGKLLATRSGSGTVRLWDVLTGRPAGAPLEDADTAAVLAFRPDGKALLTGSLRGTAQLWDLTGKPFGQPMKHNGSMQCGVFSPDGNLVATGGWNARVWNAATGKAVVRPLRHPDKVQSLAFLNNNLLLTGSIDGMARLWDVRTGEQLRVYPHPNSVAAVKATAGSGQFLTITNPDQVVRLWSAWTGIMIGAKIPHQCTKFSELPVAFSADMKTIATSVSITARVWEQAEVRPEIDPALRGTGLYFGPGGQAAWSLTPENKVRLWTIPAAGAPAPLGAGAIDPGEKLANLKLSRDGKTLLTYSSDSKRIRLWDVATGKERTTLRDVNNRYCQQLSDDGQRILAGGWDTATLYDVKARKRQVLPHEGAVRVRTAAFSPDGQVVATGSQDGVVRLWNVKTGKLLAPRFGHRSDVVALAFSRDGKSLLSGSPDGTARLWDVTTGNPLTAPLQHSNPVEAVAISPDGKTILTGVFRRIQIWDAATGKPLGMPTPVPAMYGALVFSPDGKTYFTDNQAIRGKAPQTLPGDVERLTQWVQVLTGLELDESGTIGFLDAATWQQRRQLLEKRGGAPAP